MSLHLRKPSTINMTTDDPAIQEACRQSFHNNGQMVDLSGKKYICTWYMGGSDTFELREIFIVRPYAPGADWNGEGLPPVGVVCEYLWQWSDKVVYVRIKVLSHDEERAQFRVISGGGIGSLRECNQRLEGGLSMFRPIRTPEQIAAEERKAGIAEIFRDLVELPWHNERMAEGLYDAGYRKQADQ